MRKYIGHILCAAFIGCLLITDSGTAVVTYVALFLAIGLYMWRLA